MDEKTYGALSRIVREVKEKRKAKCLNIDCAVNHNIGGNDIDLVETWLDEQNECVSCKGTVIVGGNVCEKCSGKYPL